MILISHRGNIDGVNKLRENKIDYINEAIKNGFDVEIDVWWKEDGFYLGHDEPQYKVSRDFLREPKFWCHAKNVKAFYQMVDDIHIHCFLHDRDELALTTRGYLWSLSETTMTDKSICVMPSLTRDLPKNVAGICCDFVSRYE